MQNNVANYGMLTSAGAQEEQQQQNDINAQMAKFQQAFTYPQQQLGNDEIVTRHDPLQYRDVGEFGVDAKRRRPTRRRLPGLETMGMLGDFAGAGLLGSDRRLKTDIKRVDTHATGLPIYAYRYKGDPKHYPKVVGPMAEDVAKIAPHAVRPMGVKGRLAVHMPTLDALGASATPPSSPGVARAIGMLAPSGMPGRLSPNATPPTRSPLALAPRMKRIPMVGALSG